MLFKLKKIIHQNNRLQTEKTNSNENMKHLKEIVNHENLYSSGEPMAEGKQNKKQEIPFISENDLKKEIDLENLLSKMDSEEDKVKPLKIDHEALSYDKTKQYEIFLKK